MSRRPYIMILIILLVAVAAVLGYMYLRERPQVSKDETKVMLEGYKAGLEERYAALNETYEQQTEVKNVEEWKAFSTEWIPGLSGIRPTDVDKRLPSEYEGKKNLLISTQGALISLWTEYNRDFIENDAADEERAEEIRTGIEDIFKNLEI